MSRNLTLQHSDYTVAWICAVPLELEVSKLMFDKRHNSLPNAHDTVTVYELGSMGRHNVVMASLPTKQIGNQSAASVTEKLVRTFPSVRVALLVGYGGGVPGGHRDIRLGDIVVNQPDGQFTGVLKYGDLSGNQISKTRINLSMPYSKEILDSLSRLKAGAGAHLTSNMKATSEKPEARNVGANVDYPGTQFDLLFQANYDHMGEYFCGKCDRTKLVPRRNRASTAPVVHYGNIGSVEKTLKITAMRDKLGKDDDVLCFEMEAAGVLKHLPCLTFRGISDKGGA